MSAENSIVSEMATTAVSAAVEATKTCNKCSLVLQVAQFPTGRNTCTSCKIKYNRERAAKLAAEQRQTTGTTADSAKKTCKSCEKELSICNFEPGRLECKKCRHRKKTERSLEQRDLGAEAYRPENCVQCGIRFTTSNFSLRSDRNAYNSICNTCKTARGNKYSQIHRAKNKGNPAILRRNAETHRAYVATHSDQIQTQAEMRQNNPIAKLGVYRSSACQKQLHFQESDAALFMKQFVSPCYYCGISVNDSNTLNGLDRINNDFGYIKDNVVACCTQCNYMKGSSLSVEQFVAQARQICANHQNKNDDWPFYPHLLCIDAVQSIPRTFEKQTNDKWYDVVYRSPRFETNDLQDSVWFKRVMLMECYYCGTNPLQSEKINGLDRINGSLGYMKDNVLPCCSVCNIARGNYSIRDFVSQMCRIRQWHVTTTCFPTYSPDPNVQLSVPESRPRMIHEPSLQGCRVCFYDATTGAIGRVANTIKEAAELVGLKTSTGQVKIHNPQAIWVKPNWKARCLGRNETVVIDADAASTFANDLHSKMSG